MKPSRAAAVAFTAYASRCIPFRRGLSTTLLYIPHEVVSKGLAGTAVPLLEWRVVRNPVAVVEIASPTSMLTHYCCCVYVLSDSLRFQGMLANEKSKGMGDQEEGMDLADEVDMGGKVQQ